MAANLAQAGEGGEHVNFALVDALLGDGGEDLFAAAAEFGEVEFALFVAELAIAALFDAVGQVLGDALLEAAEQKGPELGGEAAAGDALRVAGVLAAGLVGLG